jgi:LmbE family N-acetylglucosaminyl deacetylase
MTETLRLMCVLAHPDDESLGTGGTLARYAAEGIETYLVTATRGERGWTGPAEEFPGLEALGRIREEELRAASEALGICQIHFLDYIDGDLDQADPAEAIGRIVPHICRVKPHVVITFGADGAYGHPDHIAISQFTTASILCAADSSYTATIGLHPHRTSKLYHMVVPKELNQVYLPVFGDIRMSVDGVERRPVIWEDWAITTRIDAQVYWETVWRAVACHRTQLPNYDKLEKLGKAEHQKLWGHQTFYRVFSLVSGGRELEHDLFEGLR